MQTASAAAVSGIAKRGGASVITVSWDRPRAAPGDTVKVVVRGPVEQVTVCIRAPHRPAVRHVLALDAGRGEVSVEISPPKAPGVEVWEVEAGGAVARLEVIANRFVFGL